MWRTGWLTAVCAVLAMLGAQTALAVTIRADLKNGASQILNLGANPLYASVGRFDGSTSSSGFVASGTLIEPGWVLTAAHVVDQTTSLRFSIGGSSYTADSWYAAPNWTGDLSAGYDIGLVHLASPVNTYQPATLYAGSSEFGQLGTFVGYGMTGTGLTGAKIFDGQKRAAQNMIDGREITNGVVNPRLFLSDFDNPKNRRDNSLGSATPVPLEGLIAPGDSGGGVFITTSLGTFLAGVNSFGAAWDGKVNSDYGDVAGYTRVSAFTSWIESVIGGDLSSAAGGLSFSDNSLQAMNGSVPEPSTFCLLLMAGATLVLWRRLRR